MTDKLASTADEFLDRLPEILRLLARIMMEYGVVYQDAADALRLAFWHEACDGNHDELNISQMALKTGIARRTVREIAQNRDQLSTARSLHVANRIVSNWTSHKDYTTEDGKPRVLPRKGYKTAGFDDLIACSRVDIPVATVLQFLSQNNVVKVENDQVELTQDALIPSSGSIAQMDILTTNLSAHLKTLLHNVTCDEPMRRFERSLSLKGVPAELIQKLEPVIAQKLQKQLEDIFAQIQENYEGPSNQDAALVIGAFMHHEAEDEE